MQRVQQLAREKQVNGRKQANKVLRAVDRSATFLGTEGRHLRMVLGRKEIASAA